MKQNKAIAPLISLLALSLSITNNNDFKTPTIKQIQHAGSNSFTYANNIEDGEIYFIRSYQDDNKVFSIAGNSYSSGSKIQVASSVGYAYQRFIAKKIYDSFGQNSFQLIPLNNQLRNLAITGRNAAESAKLELKNSKTYDSIDGDKFRFIPSSSSTFKIATGSSGFTKYLTAENYNFNQNIDIVQKAYDNNHQQSFLWRLMKTDSMGLNKRYQVYASLEGYDFNLRVPTTGNYIIKTEWVNNIFVDTCLSLKTSSGSQIAFNDDYNGSYCSCLDIQLQANTDYKLNVSAIDDYGFVDVIIYPKNQVFFNSYVEEENLDTREDMNEPDTLFNLYGYIFNHNINSSKADLGREEIDGFLPMQREYYMISTHGSTSGAIVINPYEELTGNTGWYYPNDLPNMSTNTLSVWSVCHGGMPNNIAQNAAQRGSTYSLGWNGTIGTDTSRYFTNMLWLDVLQKDDSTTIPSSVQGALNDTASNFWYKTLMGTWGESDDTLSPILYHENATITFSANSSSRISPNFGSFTSLSKITPSNNMTQKLSSQSFVKTDFNNFSIYFKQINGCLSNEYYIETNRDELYWSGININENNLQYFSDSSLPIVNNGMKKTFVIKTNNSIKLITWQQNSSNYDDKLSDQYFNELTKENYSEETFYNMFGISISKGGIL